MIQGLSNAAGRPTRHDRTMGLARTTDPHLNFVDEEEVRRLGESIADSDAILVRNWGERIVCLTLNVWVTDTMPGLIHSFP